MRLHRKRLLSLQVGVALIALAGCGDNSDGGPQSLSKAAFTERADAICAAYEPKLDAILVPDSDPAAPGASAKTLRQAANAGYAWAALERGMASELRALTPPRGFQSRWDTALDNLGRRRADNLDRVGKAATAGDREALARAFGAADQAGTQGRRAVAGYGFKVCGVGS